jgi:hypothetical protein
MLVGTLVVTVLVMIGLGGLYSARRYRWRSFTEQFRQLGDIGRDAPRLSIEGRQVQLLPEFGQVGDVHCNPSGPLLSNLAAERRPGSSSK